MVLDIESHHNFSSPSIEGVCDGGMNRGVTALPLVAPEVRLFLVLLAISEGKNRTSAAKAGYRSNYLRHG